jgi:signal transduction histidine kinase
MKSLRFRVLAVVAGFSFVTALLLAAIMFSSVRGYYADMTHEKANSFVDRVLEMHPDLWAAYRASPESFGARLRELILYSPNTGLYLLDHEGKVLASASEGSPASVDMAPLMQSLAEDPDAPIVAEDPEREGRTTLVSARPVLSEGEPVGWLYVISRASELTGNTPELLRSYAVRTAVTVSLMTLTIGVLLTITMIAVLTRPLIELTRAVERVRNAGFTEEVVGAMMPGWARDDEIGRLSRTFHETLERLRTEMQRVRLTDAHRREMVASVSHDLRTPLTALIGQLETIRMKRAVLPPEEVSELFTRAQQNAQHLQRLTDALAELARLDSPEFRTHPEPIAIGELADDVVQRFAARAGDSGLSLTLDYPDGLPLARVDAALVERALANLIDNAVRVTPHGGRITVCVVPDADRVRIEVSDTGPGVAPEDQPRVFERFYQAARHRDLRGSAGLGLAIVRRVAELHGGQAGLRSRPGAGATFFIELPLGL